jgi:hypothetical protein
MEPAPNHSASLKANQLCAEKGAGISKKIPASLGETPEGNASLASQK